jgi:putative ABC transport system substrate-binding protein
MANQAIRFTAALLLTLLVTFPLAAQPVPKVARVGVLSSDPPSGDPARWFDAFRHELRELGWEEGRNVILEVRRAPGRYDLLDNLAAELVRLRVDVLVADSTPAALAAKRATRTIPIVLALVSDPVGTGLVASLARPGGNITGMSIMNPDLARKRLELLKEVAPTVTRVAVLTNPANPYQAAYLSEAQSAARALGVEVRFLDVRGADDVDGALSAATSWRAQAMWMLDDATLDLSTKRIVSFATTKRLPTIFDERTYTERGGLMSYGASFTALFGRAAVFVDKILKGANPADLPVEQPTQFELVVNLKTAKALGIKIPESVLLRADKVVR